MSPMSQTRRPAQTITISLLDPCRAAGPGHGFSTAVGRCRAPGHGNHFRITVTMKWVKEHDNGHLISIGAICGEDCIPEFDKLRRHKGVVEMVAVSQEAWAHSGCQSQCVQRGADECRW